MSTQTPASANLFQRPVKTVMNKHVVAVHPQDSIHEALALMVENRVSALPVVDSHGRCGGIISTSDIIDLTYELDEELAGLGRAEEGARQWIIEKLADGLDDRQVTDLMTSEVSSVCPECSLVEAASIMRRHHVHRLPVIDKRGHLVGILSTLDVLDALIEAAPAAALES
ncbi:MAG: CBS domain-containing protein [Planctomycetales bacterium]|nr:CBS domain-containing protein [Planctomycetales bacterium]